MLTLSDFTYSRPAGPLVRRLVAPATGPAANDNGGGKSTDPAIVEAALRHFAEHGLGAARAARHKAEQAFFADDRVQYRWWLEVCRQLDRRMAVIASREFGLEHS